MSTEVAFQFINTSKPTEYLSPANRKLVRSNATQQRSRKRRRPNVPHDEHNSIETQDTDCSPQIGVQLSPLPVKMEQHMYSMLEYQETVVGPSLFPVKELFDLHPGHRIMMCMALQDTKVLNGAVAIACLRLLYTEQLSNSDLKSGMVMALRYKQQTIELVKSHMIKEQNAHIDIATALSIMNLATLEVMTLNAKGWHIHMRALRRLTEAHGAKKTLSIARFTILDVDLIGCYMFDTQPQFSLKVIQPSLDELRESQPEDIKEMIDLSSTTFSCTNDLICLDGSLVDCFVRMRDLNGFITEGANASYRQARVQAFIISRFSLEYKIIDIAKKPELNNHSKAACLAAQIYINRVFRTFHKTAEIPHRLAVKLRGLVFEFASKPLEIKEVSGLMLWIAVMGGIGARDANLRQFFISTISSLCNTLGLVTCADIREQLSFWSWSEEYLGAESRVLWSEVNMFHAHDHSFLGEGAGSPSLY
ncbi:fungal-specific transcription factor domain-containing protein [Phaeosphaeriaceae sp. PMI808]|nr:fungal-specific transcription factor domain-containing protein [Phaeosphaeriaceae sp. PMI808]